ncbi:unnamed protein product [Linum trigynum]|uniref:Uncharacterized protein n=1 Tax=Linum trigynum TaxID=586398 RepID=A0AAV2FRY2_9ROSI
MDMEKEFRTFRDDIDAAVKSIIEVVKATRVDALSMENFAEVKKDDQKDDAEKVKASTSDLLSMEQPTRREEDNQKDEVEKPSKPIPPTFKCVKTQGLGVKISEDAKAKIRDGLSYDRYSESPSVKVAKMVPCKQVKAYKVEKFILLSDESVAPTDGCAKTGKVLHLI